HRHRRDLFRGGEIRACQEGLEPRACGVAPSFEPLGLRAQSARWVTPTRGVHMVGRDIFQMLLDAHTTHDRRLGRWVIDPTLDTYAWSGRPRVACRRARNGPLPPLARRSTKIAKRAGPFRESGSQGGDVVAHAAPAHGA